MPSTRPTRPAIVFSYNSRVDEPWYYVHDMDSNTAIYRPFSTPEKAREWATENGYHISHGSL